MKSEELMANGSDLPIFEHSIKRWNEELSELPYNYSPATPQLLQRRWSQLLFALVLPGSDIFASELRLQEIFFAEFWM
jgi:anti-sigma-K factor RskA